MNDIDLLPEELRYKSLSNKEIVLKHEDTLIAIDILCKNNWGVLGWETWFRYPNGKISGIVEVDGVTYIESTDWDIDENFQTWDIFVRDSLERCRNEITNSYSDWAIKLSNTGIEPYYCIAATDKLEE